MRTLDDFRNDIDRIDEVLVRLLNELAVDLSPKQALELGGSLAELLVESYEVRRLSPPRWVRDLVRHYESRPGKAASDVA